MLARIYQPARNAMQSGRAKDDWILEFAPEEQKAVDPLMGWTGSGDMNGQIKMNFTDKDQAVAYAKKHGIAYIITEQAERRRNVRPGGYGGNFAADRRQIWTH